MDLSLISRAIFLLILKIKILISFLSFFCLYQNIFPQVNTEKFRIATDSIGFSVRSDIDITLMAGNTDFSFLGTDTRFNYNWGTDYTFLVVNSGFGINDGKSFFSQTLLHLRNVNSVSDFVSIEEFLQYNDNKQILLLHRALIGGGLRLKLINNDEITMRIGPAIFFEYESYNLDAAAKHKSKVNHARLSLYLTSLLKLQEGISFLSIMYLQPKVNDFKDLKILFDSALNIKLGKTVDFVVKLQIRYDSLPADTIEKFDLVTKLGIALNL